jgi:protein O-GlcNAc transferase
VFACLSRADKIDPATFLAWCRALSRSPPTSVLWLLSSGPLMEANVRAVFSAPPFSLPPSRLIFAPLVPTASHVSRLAAADVFLDTPAYNAHTVGCDCLSVGVPLLSLLKPEGAERATEDTFLERGPDTDKISGRVGASLLRAVGLDDLMVAGSLREYEDLMVRCAEDERFWGEVAGRVADIDKLELFDTEAWVRAFEGKLREIVS